MSIPPIPLAIPRRLDRHQLIRLFDRQGPPKHRIHETEDRQISAETKRQYEHSHDGEAATFEQHPQAILQIVPESVHRCPPDKVTVRSQTSPSIPLRISQTLCQFSDSLNMSETIGLNGKRED